MLRMRFGSFVWPNNPRTYTISCKRQTAVSKRVMADRDAEDPATLGTVSIGGKNPAVVTDAEKRQAKVISPGGYCWNPAATDCVLVVKGNELYVAGMPQEGTKGLRAGEVMLFSKGASVKVTNDGKILLNGDVYVQGDLYVNGQKMEFAGIASSPSQRSMQEISRFFERDARRYG